MSTQNDDDGWDKLPSGWEVIDHPSDENNIDTNTDLNIEFNITQDTECDAIIALAGGIISEGELHPWVKRRLLLARYIYLKQNSQPKIICLGGGSYHIQPIVNKNGFVIHESTACSEFLIKANIPPNNIYREWSSYDTVANGFFAFSNFIIPMKLKKCVMITSEFHMVRSKLIFDWMNKLYGNITEISFISVSDEGLDKDIIDIRVEREKASAENLLKNVISNIASLEQFHKWFYEDHKAYCSNLELIRTITVSEEEKKSY